MNILLVEPDRKLAEIYAQAFRLSGYAVSHSATAQQGILAADAVQPDIVVLEFQLVRHSGIEFLYEFRSYADWRRVPVIILSHVSPREFRASEQLLNYLGVTTYHYKPRTSLKELLASISEASQLPLGLAKDDS